MNKQRFDDEVGGLQRKSKTFRRFMDEQPKKKVKPFKRTDRREPFRDGEV